MKWGSSTNTSPQEAIKTMNSHYDCIPFPDTELINYNHAILVSVFYHGISITPTSNSFAWWAIKSIKAEARKRKTFLQKHIAGSFAKGNNTQRVSTRTHWRIQNSDICRSILAGHLQPFLWLLFLHTEAFPMYSCKRHNLIVSVSSV